MIDVNRLLALANGAALHKELQKRQAGVSYRTVARWIGEHPDMSPPAAMVPLILDAFGLPPQTEAPVPEWVRGLVDELVAEVRMNRDAILQTTGTELAALQDRMDEFLAESEPREQLPVEPQEANANTQHGAARGPKSTKR